MVNGKKKKKRGSNLLIFQYFKIMVKKNKYDVKIKYVQISRKTIDNSFCREVTKTKWNPIGVSFLGSHRLWGHDKSIVTGVREEGIRSLFVFRTRVIKVT